MNVESIPLVKLQPGHRSARISQETVAKLLLDSERENGSAGLSARFAKRVQE